MKKENLYPVPEIWKKSSWCNFEQYQKLYDQSLKDPDSFWANQSNRVDWIRPWSELKSVSFTN